MIIVVKSIGADGIGGRKSILYREVGRGGGYRIYAPRGPAGRGISPSPGVNLMIKIMFLLPQKRLLVTTSSRKKNPQFIRKRVIWKKRNNPKKSIQSPYPVGSITGPFNVVSNFARF